MIGFGSDFDVSILENLVKAGTQPGIVSGDLDEAFKKILEKFEQTPSAKVFIPGQAQAIEVPLTYTDHHNVTFSTSIVLKANP